MSPHGTAYLSSHLAGLEEENRALRELLARTTAERDRAVDRLAALGEFDLAARIGEAGYAN